MATRPKSLRVKRSNRRSDFEYDNLWSPPNTRVRKQTPQEESDEWPILEVTRKVDENHVEVKWAPTKGRRFPNSIVDLRYNAPLRKRLQRNGSNPHMKALHGDQMMLSHLPRDLRILQQHIYDNLGYHRTASRQLGHQRRVTVVIPFPKQSFVGHFLQGLSLPLCQELLEEKPLENCFRERALKVTPEYMTELDNLLGDGWDVRTFDTNTVCRVIRQDNISIGWGYHKRKFYSHRNCPRCNWTDQSASARPVKCSPEMKYIVGEPELHFTFTRRRGHWMAGMA
ncbi:Hypp8488 [Branchiostoma lanceolatum]|uniref:Hypp8488 protein n=2 Tax=Branchiostoma lanceolatum TaxID=7740 RepID=A0A8J9Z709_BRALA|nr:Hypp8488 [Branchiostoma lanceolatum]